MDELVDQSTVSLCWQAYKDNSAHLTSASGDSVIYAVLGALTALIVLGFFANTVVLAIDAVYVCYMLDLESNVVTKIEVHELYNELPGCKKVGVF